MWPTKDTEPLGRQDPGSKCLIETSFFNRISMDPTEGTQLNSHDYIQTHLFLA